MASEISTHEQYKLLELAKNAIDDKLKNHSQLKEPRVMIICGSGLGGIVNVLDSEPKLEVGYSEIPGFRSSTVPGHAGKLVFGLIGSKKVPVMCMVGRLHFYEGYSFQETTFPIRAAKLLGVSTLIVTNAAGGIRESFKPGDLMIINDHINFPGLAGFHSLRGPNLDKFGTRFQALSDAYGHDLRRLFHVKSKELKVTRKIHEGTYVFVAGPSFETRAEVRMIRTMGGDAVGMSTVPEVVVARHCGLDVLALSLITNAGNGKPPPSAFEEKAPEQEDNANHDEVLKAADEASHDVQNIIAATVNEL
ncbi:Piso0_000898 [Millerozyma farinosa CBS 7064]|uniref:Purine nucleoside phosphorylase n=1 Tax=Pichia sorbitophila (strain ATCC MYA-4447 / BCRC 22081 / CBS 7064 / NBRC 10061 / NRRL Y-12695) TaxID=559304 RepID=G8YQD0_PICSO|nr:Piso0_000898 [Millerozyma farinosa CBS 7064]